MSWTDIPDDTQDWEEQDPHLYANPDYFVESYTIEEGH